MEKEKFYKKLEEIAQNIDLGIHLTKKIKTKIRSWKIFGGRLKPNYINTPQELVEELKKPIEQYVNELEKQNQDYESRLKIINEQVPEHLKTPNQI